MPRNDQWAAIEAAAAESSFGLGRQRPSQAQIEAGNYRHGHATIHGIDIAIENPRGSYREGVNSRGEPWRARLAAHYGYIKGTTGADGEGIDCFIGQDLQSDHVYVINQTNPDGSFDEHKAVLAAIDEEHAKRLYLDSYHRNWRGLSSIVPMTIPQFRWWLRNGDPRRAVEIGHLPHTGAFSMKRVVWDDVAPRHYGENLDRALLGVLSEIRAGDADGALLEPLTLDCIEADYDDVYLGYEKESIAATAALLRYFRDFISSSFDKAKVPPYLEGLIGNEAGETMTKEQAVRFLHRLVDIAINRKVGDYGMNPRQEKRLADFQWDARVIDDYMNKRIRHTGCRNLLRTPEMKEKYPEIDNQPAEFDSATCFDSVTYDALAVERNRLERTAMVFQRVLSRSSGAEGLKVDGYDVGKPRAFRGTANIVVLFTLTDGQTITIYFHAPGGKPRNIKPTDELISWKWMLNKKDVTIAVAPERGRDLDLNMVGRRVMALANKNAAAFAKTKARGQATDDKITALRAEVAEKEQTLSGLEGEIEAARAAGPVAHIEPVLPPPAVEPTPAPEPPMPEHNADAAPAQMEPAPTVETAEQLAAKATESGAAAFAAGIARMPKLDPAWASMMAIVPAGGAEYVFDAWMRGYDGAADASVAAQAQSAAATAEAMAIELARAADGRLRRLETGDFFTFHHGDDEVILTDELRAKVEAALGEKLIEVTLPGLEGQVSMVPESLAPKAPEPEPQVASKLDAGNAMMRLGNHIGASQRKAIGQAVRGEEAQYFYDKMVELDKLVAGMPKTYEQDGKGDQAVAYLHYFTGGSDWYITERDSSDDNPEEANNQAFGLAILNGDTEMAGTGYISIRELTAAGAELDLHWTPKTLGEIKKEHDMEPEPADAQPSTMKPAEAPGDVAARTERGAEPGTTPAQAEYVAEVLQAPNQRDTDLAYVNTVAEGKIDLSAPDIADKLEAIVTAYPDDAEMNAAIERAANTYQDHMVSAAQSALTVKKAA